MCGEHSSFRRDKEPRIIMPWEQMERLVRQVAAMGTEAVWLAGRGEPLLYPKVTELVALTTSLGMLSTATSNGSRLTESFAEELCQAGLHHLSISLNSSTPETFAKIHGVAPEGRARILAAMDHIMRQPRHPSLCASMVVLKPNAHELLGFVKDAISVGASKILLLGMQEVYAFPELPDLQLDAEEWEGVRGDLQAARGPGGPRGSLPGGFRLPAGPGSARGVPLPRPSLRTSPGAASSGTSSPAWTRTGASAAAVPAPIPWEASPPPLSPTCGMGRATGASAPGAWRCRPPARRPGRCICDSCRHLADNVEVAAALEWPTSKRRHSKPQASRLDVARDRVAAFRLPPAAGRAIAQLH